MSSVRWIVHPVLRWCQLEATWSLLVKSDADIHVVSTELVVLYSLLLRSRFMPGAPEVVEYRG